MHSLTAVKLRDACVLDCATMGQNSGMRCRGMRLRHQNETQGGAVASTNGLNQGKALVHRYGTWKRYAVSETKQRREQRLQ